MPPRRTLVTMISSLSVDQISFLGHSSGMRLLQQQEGSKAGT